MEILVTGSSGFIGSHLCRHIQNEGNQVVGVDLKGEETEMCDLKVKQNLEEIFDNHNFDLVYHLASSTSVSESMTNSMQHYRNNTISTLSLLDTMIKYGVEDIVFTSSVSVYGECGSEAKESEEPSPKSIYSSSKVACENLLKVYKSEFNINPIIYRFANVVGPSCHGVIPDFVEKCKNNDILNVLGDGYQIRSYVYIDDIIKALSPKFITILLKFRPSIYNVASGDHITVREVAEIVRDKIDPQIDIEYGEDVGWEGDVKKNFVSIEKIKKKGWEPELDSLSAVSKTAEEMI